MHNPFALLTTELMEAMLQEPKFFVRELYIRGQGTGSNKNIVPFLFTYYHKDSDVENHRAQYHFSQLKNDKYAFLYDSERPFHKERLLIAASQPSPYKCYVNLLLKKWKPPLVVRQQLHIYMQRRFKNWNNHQTNVQLKDRFGKLFLILSWELNQVEVPLEEIEKTGLCATI